MIVLEETVFYFSILIYNLAHLLSYLCNLHTFLCYILYPVSLPHCLLFYLPLLQFSKKQDILCPKLYITAKGLCVQPGAGCLELFSL